MRDVECPYCGASVQSPEPYLLEGEASVSVPSDQTYRETCPDGHTVRVVYRRPPSERPGGDRDGDGDGDGGWRYEPVEDGGDSDEPG